MSDILERLTDLADAFGNVDIFHIAVGSEWVSPAEETREAAAEITRLRAEVERLTEAWTAECQRLRDENAALRKDNRAWFDMFADVVKALQEAKLALADARSEVERLEADIANRAEFAAANTRDAVRLARAETMERAAQIAETQAAEAKVAQYTCMEEDYPYAAGAETALREVAADIRKASKDGGAG